MKKAPKNSAPSAKGRSFEVFADYHHFYVSDASCTNAVGEAWTPRAVADRLAVGDGVVGIGTARNTEVPVEVRLLDAPPEAPSDAWQHVTECSVPVPTGVLLVNGTTDPLEKAHTFTVPAGTVRVRASHAGLDTLSADGLSGKDRYLLEVWPQSAATPPAVTKRYVEAEKKPVSKPAPKEKAKAKASTVPAPKTHKQAVALAREGHTDAALAKLVALSSEGSALAGASAAELLAFRGDWAGVIEHAGVFLADLKVIGASNVFDEMLGLLALAERATGDRAAVDAALKRLPSNAYPYAKTAAAKYLRTRKAPPPSSDDERRGPPTASEMADYREDVRAESEPEALFELAKEYGVDADALALFEKHSGALDFEAAMHVARLRVARGDKELAWAALEKRVSAWWCGFVCAVAPVELLLDPALAPVLNPERCEQILSTPRSQG